MQNNEVTQKYTHNYSTQVKKQIKLNYNFRYKALQANAKHKGRKTVPKGKEQLVWGGDMEGGAPATTCLLPDLEDGGCFFSVSRN